MIVCVLNNHPTRRLDVDALRDRWRTHVSKSVGLEVSTPR